MSKSKDKRRTRYIVYVDGWNMDKPDIIFDAAYTHLIRKDYPIKDRKQFMAEFVRAVTDKEKVEVVNAWVQVRDVATFPMQPKSKNRSPGAASADSAKAEEMNVDELVIPGRESEKATGTETGADNTEEDDEDESAEIARGISMDDRTEREPESGVASE